MCEIVLVCTLYRITLTDSNPRYSTVSDWLFKSFSDFFAARSFFFFFFFRGSSSSCCCRCSLLLLSGALLLGRVSSLLHYFLHTVTVFLPCGSLLLLFCLNSYSVHLSRTFYRCQRTFHFFFSFYLLSVRTAHTPCPSPLAAYWWFI